MTAVLFCQPLNDSSESLIDLLLLPASIALQIKNDVGQKAIEIGQNNTARSWILKLSVRVHSRQPTNIGLQGEEAEKKSDALCSQSQQHLCRDALPDLPTLGTQRRQGGDGHHCCQHAGCPAVVPPTRRQCEVQWDAGRTAPAGQCVHLVQPCGK